MIVPRTRLLIWFAIIVVPLAIVAGVLPAGMSLSVAVIVFFLLAVVIDAGLAGPQPRNISLELPPVMRATQGRAFGISVRLHNASQSGCTVRVALGFPSELQPSAEELSVTLPAGSEWSVFEWPCSPVKRGKFVIKSARIEAASPLGFWSRWQTLPVACEVRVYPSLAHERKNLAAFFLNRGSFGIHAQRQIGRGREFEKLREYIPGDGLEDVHWKATAKRGNPVTKVYQIERTQEVYVIIDASRLSARPATRESNVESQERAVPTHAAIARRSSTTLERFITAALVLGLAAEQQGDLFGLLTFSDRIETFLRARNGKAHYHSCRDALYTLEPRDVAPDFDELSAFIRLRLRRRALLLFLTSLDDPVAAESFVRNVDLIRRQHLIMVNVLQPEHTRPIFSDETVSSAEQLYSHLAGHMRWQQLRELEKVMQRRGVRLLALPSEKLAADLVSQYVNVKQRQAL